MLPKKGLDLSDIQDETDIYDRLVIRQRSNKKKDPENAGLLSEKVRHVEAKRKRRILSVNNVPGLTSEKQSIKAGSEIEPPRKVDDDEPVIVHTSYYDQWMESVPQTQVKDVIGRFDEILFGDTFDTLQKCMFRLFVTAAGFGMHTLLPLPKETAELYTVVLHDIIATQNARDSMKRRFTADYQIPQPENSETLEEDRPRECSGKGAIEKTSERFPVPKRILRLLDCE